MVDVVAGLDLGSTSIKLLVATRDGDELFVLLTPTPWTTAARGCTELAQSDLSDAVIGLLGRAADRLADEVDGARVVALGASGMAEAGFLIDRTGVALSSAIAWFDPRGADEIAATPEALRREFPGRTGLPVGPIATIAKLLHLRDTGIALAGTRWLNIPEFVVHLLGGPMVTEYSLASRTGLLDQDTGQPWPAALDLLGVDDDFLPPRCSAGEALGLASHPLLPAVFSGATLTIAGHDHLVSAVAAGATASHQLYNSMGTAEALVRILDGPLPFDARDRLASAGINALRHVIPGKYVLLAGTRAGLVMRRVFQLLGIVDAPARLAIDAAAMALPVDGGPAGRSVTVTGARNDDGVLAVRVDGDGVTPAELFAATLMHGNEMSAALIAVMDREVPAASTCVLTGGWARMSSVVRARRLVLPELSHTSRDEDTAFGAALFAAFAARTQPEANPDDRADQFAAFAARFCAPADGRTRIPLQNSATQGVMS
ncbi:MAG: carbohydrate kinase [Burkholderiaceae bacterium]|nr:carbohydrate kinase [Microbacteriaceae bacterium]